MSINLDVEENIIFNRLRDQCYSNGTERDPKLCAVTFWRCAKIYMAFADDPMNLIKSAVFLNAAIVRDNSDSVVNLKASQANLNSIILQHARVQNKQVSFGNLTSYVKEAHKTMRKECLESLKQLNKHHTAHEERENHQKLLVKGYKAMQAKTTNDYVKFIRHIFDECSKLLGFPPRKFAVVGVGAIARKEITPYSEFQYVIILQDYHPKSYSSVHHYFTWLNVLFHVVLISLGETPISPSIVKKLDWFSDCYTPPGLSSCGIFKVNNLGKSKKSIQTGLVKSLNELIKLLQIQTSNTKSSEESELDLPHLLTKTCFIAGNEAFYKSFAKKAKSVLKFRRSRDHHFINMLQDRINTDKKNLEDLNRLYFLHSAKVLNYKLILFKSVSAFISTLSLVYGIKQTSSFEILEKLLSKRMISAGAAHFLFHAVSVFYGCQMNTHIKHSCRYEDSHDFSSADLLRECHRVVGVRSVVEFFAAAVSLQQAVARIHSTIPQKDFQLKVKRPSPQLWCIVLCALNLDSKCLEECKKRQRETSRGTESYIFYRYLQGICFFNLNRPSQALPLFQSTLRALPDPGKERITCYYFMGLCYMKNNDYKSATSFLTAGYRMQTQEAIAEGSEVGLVRFLLQLAICAKRRDHPKEALDHLQRGIEIRQAYPKDFNHDHSSNWFNEAGHCHHQLREHQQGLECFRKAVAAYKKETKNERSDSRLANLLYNFGACLRENNYFEEALQVFREELDIRMHIGDSNSNDIRDCQKSIEACREHLGELTIF